MIVNKCKEFNSDISIVFNGRIGETDSIMSLLSLEAKQGDIINVIIDGADESAFVEDVLDELGCNLLGIIPYDEHFSYSIEKSEPIYKYNTFAGRAFENICKRLLGQVVSDYETGLGGGFFKKDKFVLKQFI